MGLLINIGTCSGDTGLPLLGWAGSHWEQRASEDDISHVKVPKTILPNIIKKYLWVPKDRCYRWYESSGKSWQTYQDVPTVYREENVLLLSTKVILLAEYVEEILLHLLRWRKSKWSSPEKTSLSRGQDFQSDPVEGSQMVNTENSLLLLFPANWDGLLVNGYLNTELKNTVSV